ncbi:hypothetical protein QQF64_015729 [Cirrhinus molitorella]|uniref:Uncharacterized protein n=1 Tax=Cirrhinus molitorella TaxID=172907 RepID=A0ABR3NVR8_9TELE
MLNTHQQRRGKAIGSINTRTFWVCAARLQLHIVQEPEESKKLKRSQHLQLDFPFQKCQQAPSCFRKGTFYQLSGCRKSRTLTGNCPRGTGVSDA